jgi:hypothetical protein
MSTDSTTRIIHAYYDCWKRGGAIDQAGLRALLAPDLDFESSVGRRSGVDSFLQGIARFATTVTGHHILSMHCTETEAAVLYDCDLTAPMPLLRTAEFFDVAHGRIARIRLVFDATEYKRTSPTATASTSQAAGPG